jgi:hypothetical protein
MSNSETAEAAQTRPPEAVIEFAPAAPIPDYLIGEIQSKLAYVDEAITHVQVGTDHIVLRLALPVAPRDMDLFLDEAPQLTTERRDELVEKVQRVVLSMARGAIRPKIQVLEDHLQRPVPYHQDPMPELLER